MMKIEPAAHKLQLSRLQLRVARAEGEKKKQGRGSFSDCTVHARTER